MDCRIALGVCFGKMQVSPSPISQYSVGYGMTISSFFKPSTSRLSHSIMEKKTYDVVFNDDYASDSKGWHETKEECINYTQTYNGTNESYFEDYKGGVVQVVCNETDR